MARYQYKYVPVDGRRAAAGLTDLAFSSAGGRARAVVLSPERRTEIARLGAVAKWQKWAKERAQTEGTAS